MGVCIPTRQNVLTGSFTGQNVFAAAVAIAAVVAFCTFYPAEIAAMMTTALKIAVALAVVRLLVFAIRYIVNMRIDNQKSDLDNPDNPDWIADIQGRPVSMRGHGAAQLVTFPQSILAEVTNEIL